MKIKAHMRSTPAISGEILIKRPPAEVFDIVADERNEPRYNPNMLSADLVSPEPIQAGTRSHALIRNGRMTVYVDIELSRYERPQLLGSHSRSSVRMLGRKVPMLDTQGTLTFDAVAEGTLMRWSWLLRAHGPLRLLPGMVAKMGTRQEQTIWAGLKAMLEAAAPPGPTSSGTQP